MKKIIYFILAIIIITVSCTTEEKSPIEGTWQYLSSTTIQPDTVITDNSENGILILMIGEKYFSGFWQNEPEDSLDKYFEGFDFGTYTYVDGVYSESTMYASIPESLGDSEISFITEFKGDTMVWTVNSDNPDNSFKSNAFWIKLK